MPDKLIKHLIEGNVVILPTDTVYGLACLPEFEYKLNEIKGRKYQPSARIYHSKDQLFQDIYMSEYLELIVDRLLPGPFTLLIQDKTQIIGIRIPDNPICIEFLKQLNKVVVMTSANVHGKAPATNFLEAKLSFPNLEGIDGGVCKYSKPSAIINLSDVLRG